MTAKEVTYYYVSQWEYMRIFFIASFITWHFATFYYTKQHRLQPVVKYLKNLFSSKFSRK